MQTYEKLTEVPGGYIIMPHACIRAKLPPQQKIVLMYLQSVTWYPKDECNPSIQTIAEACQMDRADVIAALDDLAQTGRIERHGQAIILHWDVILGVREPLTERDEKAAKIAELERQIAELKGNPAKKTDPAKERFNLW